MFVTEPYASAEDDLAAMPMHLRTLQMLQCMLTGATRVEFHLQFAAERVKSSPGSSRNSRLASGADSIWLLPNQIYLFLDLVSARHLSSITHFYALVTLDHRAFETSSPSEFA